MAAKTADIVSDLFDKAYEINEAQDELNEQRNGVRNSLRSLKAAGVLTPEQVEQVDELYPPITRTRKNGDEPEAAE